MAILKLLLLSTLLLPLFIAIANASGESEVCSDSSSFQVQLSELQSKVQELESMVEASKPKDDEIAQDSSWLPPWLAGRITQVQSFIESSWKTHGKPPMEWALEKAMEKKTEAEKLAKSHIETIKTVEIRSTFVSVITPPIVKVIPSLKALCSWMETFAESKPQSETEHVLEHQE